MEVVVLSPAQLESLIARAINQALAVAASVTVSATNATGKLLTVTETAKLLRKSEKTVREYIKRGELPAVNANRDRSSKGKPLRPAYSVLETDVYAYLRHLRA
jgi:excisionase family DNA binding protein